MGRRRGRRHGRAPANRHRQAAHREARAAHVDASHQLQQHEFGGQGIAGQGGGEVGERGRARAAARAAPAGGGAGAGSGTLAGRTYSACSRGTVDVGGWAARAAARAQSLGDASAAAAAWAAPNSGTTLTTPHTSTTSLSLGGGEVWS